MTPTMDLPAMLARLDRLERRIQQLGRVAVVLVITVVVLSGVVLHLARDTSRLPATTVAAERFELRQGQQVQGVLRADAAGANLTLNDRNQIPRVHVAVSSNGAALTLTDANQPRATVFVNEVGPGLHFFDDAGRPRAAFGVDHEGRPGLVLIGENGKNRVSMRLQDEHAVVSLYDDAGQALVDLSGGAGGSLLQMWNAEQKKGLFAGATENGGVVAVSDEHGTPRASILGKDGGSGLLVFDAQERPRAGLTVGERPLLKLLDETGAILFARPEK